jgi:mycothiol synthase
VVGQIEVRRFADGDVAQIGAIMARSLEVDRLPGFRLSEIDRSLVRIAVDPANTAVVVEDGDVVGYCTPFLDDLTVHPDHRGRGHGTRLVSEAQRIERERGRPTLTLYVPLHLPTSIAFAERCGFRYHSSLWQFILPDEAVVPAAVFGPEVVPTVVDPRDIEDVAGWVAFLLDSFEGHPSPMGWTEEGMRRLHGSSGFDGSGVLVLAAATAPDEPIAFTRVESYTDGPVMGGEIGLIGVVPAWRRRGLGRELLRWGIAELRGRGVGPIALTVEDANDGATELYQRHGFEATVEWPHWSLPVGQAVG